MARRLKCLGVLVGGLSAVVACFTGQASAQDGAMTELYGYGVHRYYAGDYPEAQRVLDMVVESDLGDPRALYFRGLTHHNLGNEDEAKADFEQAALLEARGRRAVNVGFALQRIQGPLRQQIEMSRMMARVAVYKELLESGQVTPGMSPAVPVPPAGDHAFPPALSGGMPPALATPPATPPATAPGVVPPTGTPPTATPPATVPDAQLDPFRDDPAGTVPTPPTNDPFSTPDTSTPAPVAPAAPAAPATPSDDPFAPTATPAAPTPATPVAPAETPADPLGDPGAPADPATDAAVPAAPPADTSNPFAPAT